jgi:hypothetical protein
MNGGSAVHSLSPLGLQLSGLITFTGPVPECICMFSQLVVLVVQRCNVSGGFPFWVDSLVYLQELNLSGNYLTGKCKASAVSVGAYCTAAWVLTCDSSTV